jgi:hypothetical protein
MSITVQVSLFILLHRCFILMCSACDLRQDMDLMAWSIMFGPKKCLMSVRLNKNMTMRIKCMNTWRGVVWCHHACSAPLSSFVVPPGACVALHFRLGSSLLLLYIYMETENHDCNYKQGNSLYIPHCFSFRSRVILSKVVLWHVWEGICRQVPSVGCMTCHFAWTMTLAAASYLLRHSYLLYTCVFLFILVTAIHNRSTYMFRVFAFRFVEEQLANQPSSCQMFSTLLLP